MRASICRRRSKRGIMGIETLIIFIAMILVSAVAAGVLLKTIGALQQRALAVGNEARVRIATGLEVSQVRANANVTSQSFNEIEMTVRLAAGSYDVPMTTMSIIMNTEDFAHTARLMHRDISNYRQVPVTELTNESWVNVGNFDTDATDADDDYIRLAYNVSGNYDGIQINLSTDGLVTASFGIDIESNSSFSGTNIPIRDVNGNSYSMTYGFIQMNGTGNTDRNINTTTGNMTFYLETDTSTCSFDLLIPNVRWCYVTNLGDTDTVLESGEILKFYYKADTASTIRKDSNFDIQLVPKQGTSQTLNVFVPEVFGRRIMHLWP